MWSLIRDAWFIIQKPYLLVNPFFRFFCFFLTIIENTLYRALPASYNVKKRAHDTLFFYRYAVTTASILFFTISPISDVFLPWYASYGIGSRK